MSFPFTNQNENQGGYGNTPETGPQDYIRPPEFQDNHQAEPWFVSDETQSAASFNAKSKTVVKRTTSVLFPILGLTAILSALGGVVYFVTQMYQIG